MTLIQDRTYTLDEFLRLPDSVGFELEDEHLLERTVSEASSRIAARIIYVLQVETEKTSDANVYGSDLTYTCFRNPNVNGRRADASLIRKTRLAGLDNPVTMPGSVAKLKESDEITGETALPGFRRRVSELFSG